MISAVLVLHIRLGFFGVLNSGTLRIRQGFFGVLDSGTLHIRLGFFGVNEGKLWSSRFQVVGRIGVALQMRKRRTHQFLFHLEQLPAKLLAIQLLNQSNISYSILYYEKTLSPSISKQLFYFASFCFVITITAFDYYSVGLPRREYF